MVDALLLDRVVGGVGRAPPQRELHAQATIQINRTPVEVVALQHELHAHPDVLGQLTGPIQLHGGEKEAAEKQRPADQTQFDIGVHKRIVGDEVGDFGIHALSDAEQQVGRLQGMKPFTPHQHPLVGGSAVEQLTDVVYIELPDVGDNVFAGESFGEIESVKAVSDLYSPVDGEIIAVNEKLLDDPTLVAQDPLGKGWMVKIKCEPGHNLDKLLTLEQYEKQIASQAH